MRQRILTAELMDDPGLDPAEHGRALMGLRRLNTLSNAARPVRGALVPMLRGAGVEHARARLLDVATGGGDLLLALGRAGFGTGTGRLVGVDVSATALGIARQNGERLGITAEWVLADVLAAGLPVEDGGVDVAVCSLFLHHLDEAGVVRVLAEMRRVSRVGVVVSDLRRSRVGLALAAAVSRVVTRSRVVHVDAVKSVRSAWCGDELAALAARAGLGGATVRGVWPARLLLVWAGQGVRT
jgi:ubiquinone/menaquinone biosynthesis C-methylase UbiE